MTCAFCTLTNCKEAEHKREPGSSNFSFSYQAFIYIFFKKAHGSYLREFDLQILELKEKSCAVLTLRHKSQQLPMVMSAFWQTLPFILAEVENHVFSCIYKTDLHEVFDTPVEFVDFHRALSIHFAL